jgi:long-chain acyl-CoA synthetase
MTGDIGLWDAQGRLKVVDRVKNIFKLAQGEYIAPEKIEVIYNKHELIAQSFVYGDSLKACLVAIIIPDWDTIKGWAAESGYNVKSLAELCNNAEINTAILKMLTAYGKENGLKGFENVKGIHLASEMFTPENGILSPTFKLKVCELIILAI